MISFPKLHIQEGDTVVFDDEAYDVVKRDNSDEFVVKHDGKTTLKHVDWFVSRANKADVIRIDSRENRECFQRHDWCRGPDAPDTDEVFGGKCHPCYSDFDRHVPRTISEPVMEVWGDYRDFDSKRYVEFVMRENLDEFEEAKNVGEQSNELADIVICAMRYIAMGGLHAESQVLERLEDRMDGEQEDIIETYKEAYDG